MLKRTRPDTTDTARIARLQRAEGVAGERKRLCCLLNNCNCDTARVDGVIQYCRYSRLPKKTLAKSPGSCAARSLPEPSDPCRVRRVRPCPFQRERGSRPTRHDGRSL